MTVLSGGGVPKPPPEAPDEPIEFPGNRPHERKAPPSEREPPRRPPPEEPPPEPPPAA